MNIEMAILNDGRVMLVSDEPLPDIVKRVEYYQDQKLCMLVYSNPEHEGDLMHYEVPDEAKNAIEASPNILIYSLYADKEPFGYRVPIVQVGTNY